MSAQASISESGGLLPLGESAARGTPLRHWRPVDRDRIVDAIAGAFTEWEKAWGVLAPDAPSSRPRCDSWEEASAASPPLPERWVPMPGPGGGTWWAIDGTAEVPSAVEAALFAGDLAERERGENLAQNLAQTIAVQASEDLGVRLSAALRMPARSGHEDPGGAPDRAVLRPWMGTLVIRRPLGAADLILLLTGSIVDACLPARAPPARSAPVAQGKLAMPLRGLAARNVRLLFQLEPLELTVGSLAALTPGDVLCTRHRLDRGLVVRAQTDEGHVPQAIGSAFLGKLGAAVAVELYPLEPRSPGAAPDAP